MQIDRIHEYRLTPQDEGEIATLLPRSFGEGFGGRSYHQQRHHLRIVARNPHIVGHMALCYRDIRMGDQLVPIFGLAEVATDPDHQGKGIASALMAAALDEVRASSAAFFVLFGERPIYAGNGFVQQTNDLIVTPLHDARTREVARSAHDGLMVLPLTDLPWDGTATIDLLGFKF